MSGPGINHPALNNVDCARCRATKGNPCLSVKGKQVGVHAIRIHLYRAIDAPATCWGITGRRAVEAVGMEHMLTNGGKL